MIRSRIKRLFLVGMAGSIMVVVLGFLNPYHPAFDTMAHFRLHLSAILFAGFFFMDFATHRRFAILALSTAITGLLFA